MGVAHIGGGAYRRGAYGGGAYRGGAYRREGVTRMSLVLLKIATNYEKVLYSTNFLIKKKACTRFFDKIFFSLLEENMKCWMRRHIC